MITDSLIRKKFVRDTLHKGISKIYATQESVVRNNYQLRTGRLMTSLSKHSYESNLGTDSHIIFVRILSLIFVFSIWAIGCVTTAWQSSGVATLPCTIVWYGVCFITRHFHKFAMASRMK